MEIFNSMGEYQKVAKAGDIIALGGTGLMNGLNVGCKYDTYKFVKFNKDNHIIIRAYKGRTDLKTITEQEVGLLTKKDFNNLTQY